MKLLIPLSYLTEIGLSENIDEDKLKPSLEEAQDELVALLGPEFYEQIESQYPTTFSADNLALYDPYIKKFLAWFAYLYSIGFSQSESTPTGERSFKDSNSDLLTDIKLSAKERNIERRALRYKNKIVNFLRLAKDKDSTKYPLWMDQYNNEILWGISSIGAKSDKLFKINKTSRFNE
jgi:hypothetical protein